MRRRIPQSWIFIAITLALAIFIGGCAANEVDLSKLMNSELATSQQAAQPAPQSEAATKPIAPEEAQKLWQRVQEDGVLKVGVPTDERPPYSFHAKDGSLDGFEIALARELASQLGVGVAFEAFPAEELLSRVQAGEVDAALGLPPLTPEQIESLALSQPYLSEGMALLFDAEQAPPPTEDMAALATLKLGAVAATAQADWMLAQVDAETLPRQNASLYPGVKQAVAALVNGDIDVVLTDPITAKTMTSQGRSKLQLLDKGGKALFTFKPLNEKPLQGVTWQLSAYSNQEGALVQALAGADVTASIANAVIQGSAGCNDYAADLQINADSLTVTPPITTRKECAQPEGVMEQENSFLDNLLEVTSYAIAGDELIFRNAEGKTLLLFKARPQAPVAGITWTLYSYGDVSHPQPLPTGVNITLAVDEKGEAAGSSGCNDYNGKLVIDGDKATMELGASTLMACDPVSNAMESAYLGALAGVQRAEVQQDELLLFYNDGLDALRFRAQQQNPLQFSAWTLLAFGTAQDGDRPLETTQLTAQFDKEKLTGAAGCNRFHTTYKVTGQKIKIGAIGLIRKLCPDKKVTRQGALYVGRLRSARSYRFTGLDAVISPLLQQDYVIAAPAGADELLTRINDALAQLTTDGKTTELAGRYLPFPPAAAETEDEAAKETAPEPACTDKVKWIADVTYDDHNMRKPPVVEPGVSLKKVWRLKNVGTCTWTTAYYLDYDHGNKADARMAGERTFLEKPVKPGETVDLTLELTTPVTGGKRQGFWNLYNADHQAFAQLWVGLKVAKPKTPFPTPTPSPTPEPAPVVQLTADHTHIRTGDCTTLFWNAQNVVQAYLFPEGEEWEGKEVDAQGSKEVCPPQTTTYYLGVTLPDAQRQIIALPIQVSELTPPQIVSFESAPPESAALGEAILLHWEVEGDVQNIEILVNGVPLRNRAPLYGSLTDTPTAAGAVVYTLRAQGPGGVSSQEISVEIK